jgi:chromosome segregation ATPase
MTELERHLLDGLQRLGEQYAADMQRLQLRNEQLSTQVLALGTQLERQTSQWHTQAQSLAKQIETLSRLVTGLADQLDGLT